MDESADMRDGRVGKKNERECWDMSEREQSVHSLPLNAIVSALASS